MQKNPGRYLFIGFILALILLFGSTSALNASSDMNHLSDSSDLPGARSKLSAVQSVFDNQTIWKDEIKNLTESIDITNGGNLTIINSVVNFSLTESGFLVN
ncbi:MAG: hypothetical protein ACFFD4_27130, partial [Candidatus Odinarchaeota archaeon]